MTQLLLPFNLPAALDAEDFIVSSANQDAYLWLMRWPNWPTRCLSLYGEEGCGKTHLSYIWQKRTEAAFFSSSSFDTQPLEALLGLPPFFILDRAEHITQEEKLFHLYNHVVSSKGALLFLSNTPLAHWLPSLQDLRSRLNTIPAVKIHAPDEKLLLQVIQKLFSDLQVKVDETVILFLINHIDRSFKSASTWVDLLNTQAVRNKRNITIPFIRDILEGQTLQRCEDTRGEESIVGQHLSRLKDNAPFGLSRKPSKTKCSGAR